MGNCGGSLSRKPRNHHQKQPSEDAKESVYQPSSNSLMSSSTRDKNCDGTDKLPKCVSKPKKGINGINISIDGNNFTGARAKKLASVDVYGSQGPIEEKRDDSSDEADTQSSSGDKGRTE